MSTRVHSPETLAAAAFLKTHCPSVALWPVPRLLAWFGVFWRDARIGVVTKGDRIVAVGVARCVRTDEEADEQPYAHHEDPAEGLILWVDQLASENPLGLPVLLAQARARFGPRKWVSGHVFSRPGDRRMVPWNRVERILSHHGLI
jgi:hypothetical protein